MLKAKLGREIVVKVTNEIGIISQLNKVIAEKGVNILGASESVSGRTATLRFVTNDNLRISDALRERNYQPRETECVLVHVPHKSGMLKTVTEKLSAESIDIRNLFTTAGENDEESLVVLESTNNDHAVVVLNR